MKKVEIRAASSGDLEKFYGRPMPYSSRSFVALMEEKPIGVAGVYLDSAARVAFSDMTSDLRSRKKDIIRLACANMRAIRQHGKSVVAFANPEEPTADTLLLHLGFNHIGCSHFGKVYQWQP